MLLIISTDDTALLTVLLAKHITSCDNVFLESNILLFSFYHLFFCFIRIYFSDLFGADCEDNVTKWQMWQVAKNKNFFDLLVATTKYIYYFCICNLQTF